MTKPRKKEKIFWMIKKIDRRSWMDNPSADRILFLKKKDALIYQSQNWDTRHRGRVVKVFVREE